MVLEKFRKSPEVLPIYNYIDVVNGLGYITFYAVVTKDSSGQDEILTPNVLWSNDIFTSKICDQDALKQYVDYDWDASPFSVPKSIKGVMDIQLPWNAISALGVETGYVVFKVRKWDGATETEIASVQSETIDNSPTVTGKVSLLKLDIPETHFKKGEILRITQELWMTSSGFGSADAFHLYHDPKDRLASGDLYTTILKFNIPFKIN
ncbi:MAG: hypothetical protein AAB355_00315 [Patescibacteria group bacterium]